MNCTKQNFVQIGLRLALVVMEVNVILVTDMKICDRENGSKIINLSLVVILVTFVALLWRKLGAVTGKA